MCAGKDEVKGKIDRLIESVDRLTAALSRGFADPSQLNELPRQPKSAD